MELPPPLVTQLQESSVDEEIVDPVLEQLITHVPDLVACRPHDAPLPQTIHSYGVVMFADISGFTALCEKYCSGARSKSRMDQLTATLNSYLSQIVQSILDAGGDILKFAGDALLAFWEGSRFSASGDLARILHESQQMQVNYDNFESSDGDILRMKLAVSVGRVEIHYIGNKEYKTFDITGEAIDDVNQAQSECKAGDIVVSQTAWEMCNKQRCLASTVGEAGCMKVNIQCMLPAEYQKSTLPLNLNNEKRSSTFSNKAQTTSRADDEARIGSIDHGLNSRRELKESLPKMSEQTQQMIKHFVSKTVVHKVEHGHEVSWLSELREVCVLFINLDPGKALDAAETLYLLQTSFDVIYPCLQKFEGTLNKVFMFDKGCTFLCIFGLPHAKHEDEATRALRAARHIYNQLGELDLECFSIGVTTGVAFCGVVGHPQRHEYTVIGQKVNMAARLMMKFPNAVTCEETTRSKSSLPNSELTLTPPVTLKGISKPENIYNVSLEIKQTLHHYTDMHLPTDHQNIIGREKEMAVFLEELMHVSEHTPRDPGVIVLTGGGGMGKTKILRAMKAKAAHMGFRIVSGIGGLVEKNTPFFTVKTLITRLLELDSCKNIHEREQLLLQHITDDDMRLMLPLLNDILIMKFPQTHLTSHMTHDERTVARHKLLYSIVHQEALTKPCVFGIDDAHWIDHDSWSFLLDLALDPNAILVMTTPPLERFKEKHSAMMEILNHPHTKVVKLEGLKLEDMITLACHLLKVDELPVQMQNIIRKRSHGVPLWLEELVETMLEMNYLEIIETGDVITEEDEDNESLSGVDLNHQAPPRRVVIKDKQRRCSSTAQLSEGLSIGDIPIPDSVTGMALTRIDRLSPPGQMSLKCASVIGTTFSKPMLGAIVPNSNPVVFHQSLNALTEAGMIECAAAAQVRNMHTDIDTRSGLHLPLDDPNLDCPCLHRGYFHVKPSSSSRHHITVHPPLDECHLLQFVHTYLQETAYALWTETQRKALHESAAVFLENQAHKCTNCGGGGFIAGGSRALFDVKTKKSKASVGSGRGRAFLGAASMRNKMKRRGTRNGSILSRSSSMDSASTVESLPPPVLRVVDTGTATAADSTSESGQSKMQRVRVESICTDDLFDINMENCQCDKVLARVYPQLVHHWRAAGNIPKALHYLIQAGAAAVDMFSNMEALSLLYEAKNDMVDKYGRDIISDSAYARLESLIAQALFQSGEIEECLPHFEIALTLLHAKLPNGAVKSALVLGYHAFKQYLHRKFPARFIGKKSGRDSDMFLDQARCMVHVIHVYHLQHKNMKTLMLALKQLNAVEEAQQDNHELIEAYATMIECCQHFNYKNLATSYLGAAMTHCSGVQLGMEDMHTYTHLLCVGLNLRLCQGNIEEALELGSASYRMTSKMHDVSMQLLSLPLLLYTQMSAFMITECRESLKQLNELAAEADDLRAQALHDCCEFDALLEFGIGMEDAKTLVTAAETCCEEDIYHFDDTERFFLVSCLALWHARQGNKSSAERYQTVAQGLFLSEYETFLAVRALARYVECLLVLHNEDTATIPAKPMKKLKKLCNKFVVFKTRQLLLSGYKSYCQNRLREARRLVAAAIAEGNRSGCVFDYEWARACQELWFSGSGTSESQKTDIVYVLQ